MAINRDVGAKVAAANSLAVEERHSPSLLFFPLSRL
jgi:hypothetical protein